MLTISQLFLIAFLALPYSIITRKGRTPSTPRQVKVAKISGLLFTLGGATFAALDAYSMVAHVQTRHVLISKGGEASFAINPDTNPAGYVLLFATYIGATIFFSFMARKVWRGEKI
jgi:hypothetical protein